MSWQRVWERTFATEEEADIVYDRLLAAEEHRVPFMVVSVERFDGNTIRVDYITNGLDKMAARIEETYSPPEAGTPCKCGHTLAMHDHTAQDEDDPCHICGCQSFERSDWPPAEWAAKEEV